MDTHLMVNTGAEIQEKQLGKIRVLCVEDEKLFCKVLSQTLARQPDFEVLPGVYSGEDALQKVAELLPDVVLFDLKLKGSSIDGVPLLSRLVQLSPLSRIIVLSNYADDELILDAMNHGARGYLSKDANPEEVFEAVRAADRGRFHVDHIIARKMVNILIRESANANQPKRAAWQPPPDINELLTPREVDVLGCLLKGLTYKEIGRELFISFNTVKEHVGSILTKMSVRKRQHIPLWLAHNGYRT
jgi:DNA-binding NarL/FixJ family response regulator